MKKLCFLWLWLVSIHAALSTLQTPIDFNFSFNGSNAVVIAWNAYPGKSYQLQTTTNILGTWSNSPTLVATSNSLSLSFSTTAKAQFFKVVKLDTEGPEISQTSPLDGGFAVSRRSAIQALLSDVTGINSNSIAITIGTNTPINLSNPRLTFATNVLTYIPATNEFLGTNGQVVSVKISVADTLGNQTTNFTWSFQLELPPVISTNVYFIGAGSPGCNLTLLSTNGNYFTYSYAGVSSCIATGMHLVNTNLLTGYTRTVVNFAQYPASNTVVVLTRPTKLAELLEAGSANTGGFTYIAPPGGGMSLLGTGPAGDLSLGMSLNQNVNLQRVFVNNGTLLIESRPGSYFNLSGEFEIAANFRGLHIREFQATIGGAVDYRMDIRALVTGAANYSNSFAMITPIRKTYAALIGTPPLAVPVWVDLVFEVEAGYEANFEASAEVTDGVQAVKEILVGRHWNETNGWSVIRQNPPLGLTLLGPTWQMQGSSSLRVYVRPQITLYAYGTAGVLADLEPYLQLDGNVQLNPPCLGLAFSSGLDAHVGLDLRFWDDQWGDLPSTAFDLIPKTTLWQTNTCPTKPAIILQPKDQNLPAGETAGFNVVASGGYLTYQWQRNGLNLTDDDRITGARSSTLHISNVQIDDSGNYNVRVTNPIGLTNSAVASLNLVSSSMGYIPSGSFTMGDTLGDGSFWEIPTHTVYVSSFYIDKYKVTKALWDGVYNWATNHGYSFDYSNSGQGKAGSHPVGLVTWFDAVKWCNARSEKEGRKPAYYMSSAKTMVYRTGQIHVDNAWVEWNMGYRLPTEAEWEKAARGGAHGQRFPWGNSISWIYANYYANPVAAGGYYFYDGNATPGYHPAFNDGFIPYTSPVGYFAPNGYGLCDMVGNATEWCWDWFGSYSSFAVTDPHGPSSGSWRVERSSSWGALAYTCRVAYRDTDNFPYFRGSGLGFRSVLPSGQ